MAANEKRMPEGEPIKSDIMPEGDEEEFETGHYVPYYEVHIKRRVGSVFYTDEKIHVEGFMYKVFVSHVLPKILLDGKDDILEFKINHYLRWVKE